MRRMRLGVLLLVGVVVQAAVLLGGAVQAMSASAASTSVLVLDANQRLNGYGAVVNGPARFEVNTSELIVSWNGTLNGSGRLQLGDTCWQVLDTAHPPATTIYAGLTVAGDFQLVEPGVGVVWHSNTAGRGGKHLMLTRAADLVLYTADWKIVWQSASGPCWLNANSLLASNHSLRKGWTLNGKPAPWLVLAMQANGNLALRSGSTTVWQTHTSVPGAYLAFTANGELLVRSPSGQVLWRSNRHASTGCACWLRMDYPYRNQMAVMDYSSGRASIVWHSTTPSP